MKTEVGFINPKGKLEKLVIEHTYPYQVEQQLLARHIGRSQVRFQRPVAPKPEALQSLAAMFAPVRA